jgi:ParD-like antitoxin of type II bacterial toxin-antitoxin system
MAKSIRISDEIYELAAREAALMHRSLAQQLEHWARLGLGVEHGQATLDDVRAAAARFKSARDESDVRLGRRAARSLHFIPAAVARSAKVEFPVAAFTSRRKSW